MDSLKDFSKKGWSSTLVAILFFIIVFLVVRYTGFFDSVTFTTDDTSMTFSGPANNSLTVPFSEVISIEYIQNPDYGVPVTFSEDETVKSRGIKNGYRYGVWISPTMGEYFAYNRTSIKSCALIKTKNIGAIVFNCDDDSTTKDFAESYDEYCKEHQ